MFSDEDAARMGFAVAGLEVRKGEAWTMVHGDCTAALEAIAERGVDHVITDPPYGEHVHTKPWQAKALAANGDKRTGSAHDGIDFACLSAEVQNASASHWARIARRWVIAFCDTEGVHAWKEALERHGLDWVRACAWDKVDSAPQFTGDRPASAFELFCCAHQPGRKRWNGGGRRNVFTFPVNAEKGSKSHPTTKPTALMLEIVRLFTDVGELVLDPFAGSGSTGVAAIREGRRFVGIERDPKYFALACERLEAEAQGLSLNAARAGQVPLFGGGAK